MCMSNVDIFQHRLRVWERETSENSCCITKEVRRSLRKDKQQRNGIQSFSMVRISCSERLGTVICTLLQFLFWNVAFDC